MNALVQRQLKYPFRIQTLIGMLIATLFFWGVGVFIVTVGWNMPHYSFYENHLLMIFMAILSFLLGTLGLQGVISYLFLWKKYILILDNDGVHGVNGIAFIPWSEIDWIGNITIRYTLLGQPSNFLMISVRTMEHILKREHGFVRWRIRLLASRSRDIAITNIKKKDIPAVLKDIQETFSHEITAHHIRIIPQGNLRNPLSLM